jgi:hypothetical protein
MDYKVDLFGFHPYDFETPIADGQTLIDAPPYELFPGWVIDKQWPVATFIAVEGINYLTSEGIYEWAPGDLGPYFYRGYTDSGNPEALKDIRTGLRGEYRLTSQSPAVLYLSPIDNRLHLKAAEHGIWRLDEEQVVRVHNLDGDKFLDAWSREAMPVPPEDTGGEAQSDDDGSPPGAAAARPQAIEALYALPGHLLHGGGERVILAAADYQPLLFETLPPTDHDTWQAHRSQLAPYEAQRRDPRDLRSWLDAFPGPRTEIDGAAVANVRPTEDGFRFELSLAHGYRINGADLAGLAGLEPGEYLVENRGGAFTVVPLLPAELSLDLRQLAGDGVTAPISVTIRNTGLADAPGLVLVAETTGREGDVIELTRREVDALAAQPVQVLVDVPSTVASGTAVRTRLEDGDGRALAAAEPLVLARPDVDPGTAVFGVLQAPFLLPLVGLFALFLSAATLLAAGLWGRGSSA